MVFEFDECEGQRFIAMEFLDGMTLKHRSIGGFTVTLRTSRQTGATGDDSSRGWIPLYTVRPG
jgi:hypothetical protein